MRPTAAQRIQQTRRRRRDGRPCRSPIKLRHVCRNPRKDVGGTSAIGCSPVGRLHDRAHRRDVDMPLPRSTVCDTILRSSECPLFRRSPLQGSLRSARNRRPVPRSNTGGNRSGADGVALSDNGLSSDNGGFSSAMTGFLGNETPSGLPLIAFHHAMRFPIATSHNHLARLPAVAPRIVSARGRGVDRPIMKKFRNNS